MPFSAVAFVLITAFLTAPVSALASSGAGPEPEPRRNLPTPKDHYETYDVAAEGQALMLEVLATLPQEARGKLLLSPSVDEAMKYVDYVDWERFRPRIARVLLHGSQVLEVIPEEALSFLPLIHDAFLVFLTEMSQERFLERVVAQSRLPQDASRGERVLAFISETPSLQKLAQVLARNAALAPDFKESLQTLENGLSTMRYDDVMEIVNDEVVPRASELELELTFEDELLAEASVGAVVVADFHDGAGQSGRAACKVLKPRAVAGLEEDLQIIDRVLKYLEANGEFYQIGAAPLVDTFEEIRNALSREVKISEERGNLVRAAEYYEGSETIVIPGVLPFSSENVTCMDFIPGVKVTDAFPGRPGDRKKLARRLSDALTFDVLFSEKDVALFHGDPHAGNVFHVEDGGPPFRIALLDWGLAADFTRREREQLAQLMLGLHLKDPKRLANNLDVIVRWEPEGEEDRLEMRATLEEMLSEIEADGMFELLEAVMTELARHGYPIRYEAAIFVKSQLTISGILTELDPEMKHDDYVMGRISRQVWKEFPARLGRTIWFPAWNSHNYRSLLSNEDVRDVQFQRIGRGFKAIGKGIWYGVSFQWLF